MLVKRNERLEVRIRVVLEELDGAPERAHARDVRVELETALFEKVVGKCAAKERAQGVAVVLDKVDPSELRTE